MRIGISAPLPPQPPAYAPDPAVMAREAERLGFESYWQPEHVVSPMVKVHRANFFPAGNVAGYVAPLIALARASAATSDIKLGTAVLLAPEHNAIHLAKETATLDRYSGGRMLVGLGAGWFREEMEIMGGDYDHRWRHTIETVQVLKELWTSDAAEYHGRYYDFPPLVCSPRPLQAPHPPLLLGGRSTPRLFERVARWADGWIPHTITPEQIREGRETMSRLATEAGRDPDSIEISAFRHDLDRDLVKQFEQAGASRCVAMVLGVETEAEGLARYRQLAEDLL